MSLGLNIGENCSGIGEGFVDIGWEMAAELIVFLTFTSYSVIIIGFSNSRL